MQWKTNFILNPMLQMKMHCHIQKSSSSREEAIPPIAMILYPRGNFECLPKWEEKEKGVELLAEREKGEEGGKKLHIDRGRGVLQRMQCRHEDKAEGGAKGVCHDAAVRIPIARFSTQIYELHRFVSVSEEYWIPFRLLVSCVCVRVLSRISYKFVSNKVSWEFYNSCYMLVPRKNYTR